MSRMLGIPVFLQLVLAGFVLFALHEMDAQRPFGGALAPSVANPANIQLPVTFEMNRGQAASDVIAIARTDVGVAAFKRNEMFLPVPGSRSPLHVSFVSKPEMSVAPESASGGVVNYISGPGRSHWLQGLPLYRGLRYKSVAGGIDLVLHGTEGRIEYDFDLAPQADVSSARLRIEDQAGLSLQPDGSLLVTPVEGGSLRFDAPTAFQFRSGSRTSVKVSFEVRDRTVGFRVGSYDSELPLVIDPVVAYTKLIGVNNGISVDGLGVDSSGDVIFTGSSFANNLPVVNGSQRNSSGSEQVYVTKLDSTGANVLFSTYLPATGFNRASNLVLDSTGNVYVSGITQDPAFPVTSQNLGSCSQFFCHTGFVIKLDPSGKVVYSTLIGSGQQLPKGLAVDSAGQVLVAGLTADDGLKTVNAYDPDYISGECSNCSAGFFGKLNATGTDWVYSSYFPLLPGVSFNQQYDEYISALAVDASGNFYIGGTGAAFTLLRPLVISSTNIDPGYTFIAKFSADGQKLLFSTDLPALSINGLQAAADGTLFIAGNATTNFPYTMNSLGPPFPPLWAVQDPYSMFAAAISPAEDRLTYAAYLGHGFINATTLGPDGNFYLAGSSNSIARLPLQNALETDVSSGGFVLSLTPSGQLAVSTPFGGHFEQQVPNALAVDSGGNIFLASTPGPSGILSNDPLDPVNVGTGAAYSSQAALGFSTSFLGFAVSIAKISPSNQPQISLGYLGPYLVLRNAGSADLHISSITYTGGLQKSWGNCGSTIPAGSSCFLVPGTNSGFGASGTLTINSDAQPSQQTFTPYISTAGTGRSIGPFIYVEDVPLLFPPQVSGSTSPAQTLQLTNLGASSASVTVRANGPTSPIQVNSNCGTLAPWASCTAQMTYSPSSGSNPGGGILINSNSPVTNDFPFAYAAGLNTSDPLQLSAPLLSFETAVVGQHSLPHPITLTNATSSALAVPSPVISNHDFAVSASSCASELEPAQTCAMAIVYSPSAAGPAVQATLTLDGNSTQLFLVGTPMATPTVSAQPSSLSFGPIAAGGAQSQTVTISNNGSLNVPVNDIVTSTQEFTESDNCIGTLASQQECSINVSFTPAGQIGTFSGTLSVSLNGGAITLPVALAGTSTRGVAATSIFSVESGTYPAAQSVSITDATNGATIYYTTNGTTPTVSSSVYGGPITVSASETLEAMAVASGYAQSAVALASYTIDLPKTTPTITWPLPAAIPYGTALGANRLDVTSKVSGTFDYSPPGGTVLSAGTQTLWVTFTPADSTKYATAKTTVTLTVKPALLTVTANSTNRAYAAPNPTFTAALTGFVNGDTQAVVTGTPLLTTTATASSPVGTYPITAAQDTLAAGNYTFKMVIGTLTVTKATPVITWATPAAIKYGAALSATQLDATSPVAGTFSYSPAAGSVPGAGSQKLSTVFSPTDATDYSTANASVTLMVNQATPTAGLKGSASSISYGASVTLTSTLSGSGAKPTGTVTFLNGATTLGTGSMSSGVATLTTT